MTLHTPRPGKPLDGELIGRVAAGRGTTTLDARRYERAVADLHRLVHPAMVRAAATVTAARADGAQQAFHECVRKIETEPVPPDGYHVAWFATRAKWRARDLVRPRGRRDVATQTPKFREDLVADFELNRVERVDLADIGEEIASRVDAEMGRARLANTLDQMSALSVLAVTMPNLCEWSVVRLAAEIDAKRTTLNDVKNRATNNLRRSYEPAYS